MINRIFPRRRSIPIAALGALPALLLGGCAATIQAIGEPAGGLSAITAITVLPSRTAAPHEQQVTAAVREALSKAAVVISANAAQQAEVGFAISDPKVSLTFADGRPAVPAGRKPPFCRAQTYSLSIVFTDRDTGTIRARTRAQTTRCGTTAIADLLPALAEAAVRQVRS